MPTLSELMVSVGADISGFATALGTVATTLDGVGTKMADTGDSAGTLNTNLGSLGDAATSLATDLGLALSAYELLKTSFEDFSSIQKAELSMTTLTGDAQGATDMIGNLRDMAMSQGLDFPSLVTAAQRMTALGISSDQTTTSLQSIADAAAATDNPIETVAGAFDRIVESGTTSGRTLVQLGLNLQDLGDVMGVTADQATTAFKALDQSDRIEVLNAALQQFQGTAQAAGDGLAGSWDKAKLSVTTALEGLGESLAPVATNMLNFVTNTITLLDQLATKAQSTMDQVAGAIDKAMGAGSSAATLSNVTWAATGATIGAGVGAMAGGIGAVPGALIGGAAGSIGQLLQQYMLSQGVGASTTPAAPPSSGVGSTTDTGDTLAGTGLSSSAQAAIATAQLSAALQDAQKNLALVSQAYKDGLVDSDTYTAAQMRVTDAFAALNPSLVQIGSQFGDLQPTMDQLTADIPSLNDALTKLGITNQDGTTKAQDLEQAMIVVRQGYDAGQIDVNEYNAAVDDFTKKMQALNGEFQATTGPIVPWDVQSQGIQDMGDTLDVMMPKWDGATASSKAFFGVFDSAYGSGSIKGLTKDIQDATTTGGQFNDEVVAGVPDISELNAKLQDATTAYNQLQQSGANNYQMMEAQRTVLTDQIALYQQQGLNTSDLTVKLNQLNASLQSQPTLWSTVQTAMKSVGDELKTGIGTAIDSVIDGTASLGDAFTKLGENILDIIVNKIIALGVQKLFDALTSLGGPLGSIGTALGGIATQASGLGSSLSGILGAGGSAASIGASGTGAIGDIVGTGDTLAGVGSAASSGASSILGGLSSLTSVLDPIGDISSAVSAITGIMSMLGVGNSGDQLDRLNAIDNATTRLAQIYDVQLLPWFGDWYQKALYFYSTQFDGWFHDFCFAAGNDFDGIHQDLDQITPNIQRLADLTASNNAVMVNIQGNMIGNQSFLDQLTQAIAAGLKTQGAIA